MYERTREEIDDSMLSKIRDLLIEQGIPAEYNSINLSTSQKLAFEKFKNGESILILGSAGTGKSKLVKEFVKYIKSNDETSTKNMYITSTTGISAYNIGGITINSFMGIGTGRAPVEVLLKRLRYRPDIKERIRRTDILVIDELSMMSASLFEKINIIFQTIRKSKNHFGGIQLILTGDFLQLETVFTNELNGTDPNVEADHRLLIESDIFNKMFLNSTIILKENFRQSTDNVFIDILTRIRKAVHTKEDINTLNTRLITEPRSDMIHLVSSNKKAQEINNKRLSEINSREYIFESSYTHSGNPETCELLQKELQSQFTQRGIDKLILKKGCRVILIKNLDVECGLVNGLTGTVKDIIYSNSKSNVISVKVSFDNDITRFIEYSEWELDMDNSKVVCRQLPLMLAYSITIHRSQSLSLERAVLDLSDCFCNHMVYVALSRVRSLDGIYLKSFNHKKITVNNALLNFVNKVEVN
jgi:ATP-dependent DNA helicase PIF1